MSELTNQEKIDLYQSIFRGREDIFAVPWQSADGTKKGYSPVCLNEWRNGVCLKLNRGHCRECNNQPPRGRAVGVWVECMARLEAEVVPIQSSSPDSQCIS